MKDTQKKSELERYKEKVDSLRKQIEALMEDLLRLNLTIENNEKAAAAKLKAVLKDAENTYHQYDLQINDLNNQLNKAHNTIATLRGK